MAFLAVYPGPIPPRPVAHAGSAIRAKIRAISIQHAFSLTNNPPMACARPSMKDFWLGMKEKSPERSQGLLIDFNLKL